jgi:ESS family glutamate:Na+ symporter
MLELDLIHTLAFAGVALLAGYGLRRAIPILHAYNLPAPVLGGLVIAVAILVARSQGFTPFRFDTTLQSPLMIASFTTLGFGASLSMLRMGGPQVMRFFAIATVFAVVQNVAGVLVALAFGLAPLFGVLAGSVTLTGGPATGLAFAPLFEQAGVTGAGSIAIAAAMGGIIAGGLVGGPLGTFLVRRHRLRSDVTGVAATADSVTPNEGDLEKSLEPAEVVDGHLFSILKNFVAILVAMWIGSWVSRGFAALGLTLPAYIGAMLVAAGIRNFDDATGWLRLSYRFIDTFGAVALSLFLVMALMTLKLWELAGLALPLLVIVLVQVGLAALVAAGPVFRLMGRNYEAAVMSGGFLGFMLGTTANAMAVMQTLAERYGPAPRAFLVAPMVGAFFIDFTNALIITLFLNVPGLAPAG